MMRDDGLMSFITSIFALIMSSRVITLWLCVSISLALFVFFLLVCGVGDER